MSKGMKGKQSKGMPMEKAKDSKKTLKRLMEYLKIYKFRFVIILVTIILYVLCQTQITLLLTPIIDDYITPIIQNDDNAVYVQGLIRMMLIFISLIVGASVFQFIQSKLMINIAQNTVKQMREDLFKKIEKLPIKYFDTHKHGELMSRIVNDLDNVGNALNTSVNDVIAGILTVIITLISMITISVPLTIITILTIPVMVFAVGKITSVTKKQFVKQQTCLGEVNGYIEEYISGIKVVKAFNKEENVEGNFDVFNQKLKNEGFKAQAFSAAIFPIMGGINNLSTAIIAVVSGLLAIAGRISVGSIITFNQFAQHFGRPINEIAQQFNVIQAGLAGAERMFEIIDEEVEFPENEGKPLMTDVKGKVEFKDVYFGYEEGKPILKDINIVANPGETIAIVGPTGAGKTTIINLLTRFYDVTSGEILIDGKNIRDVDKYSLRNALGIVLQDTVMFSETVKENIRFGKLDATDEEIKEAAKLANAHSFIKKLPHQYETELKEDSSNISIGQKQLLNISRVVLNDPDILVLDEATSNVDTRTEVRIQEAMNKLLEGRTSFVIAHRLSTIRNADKILVVNDGRIVEQGNHEELLEKQGIYFGMYNGMFGDEEEDVACE